MGKKLSGFLYNYKKLPGLNRGPQYRERIGTLHRRRHCRPSRFTATDRPAFIITL